MQTARPHGAPAPPLPRRCTSGQRPVPAHVCRANYRWSADAGGGRKRESLYGNDDMRQQGNSSSGGGEDANDAASAAWTEAAGGESSNDSAWGQGDWGQQWAQAGAGDAEAQQAAWEAAPAGIVSQRAERRRTRQAAGGGRLGRRQQRMDEQQGAESVAAAEQATAQQAAGDAAVAELAGDDPWVEAELRQLRRAQRRSARNGAAAETGAAWDGGAAAWGGGAAAWDGRAAAGDREAAATAAAGGASLPDPWSAEWGPLAASPGAAAAAAEDYGWGAESWVQDGALGRGRRRRQQQQRWAEEDEEEDEEGEQEVQAGAGPGSAWDFAQQQQELRRRQQRRRRRQVAGDDADAVAADAAAAAAAGRGRADSSAAYSGPGEYGSGAAGWAADAAAQQQQQQQQWGNGSSADAAAAGGQQASSGPSFDEEYYGGQYGDYEGDEDGDEDEDVRWGQYSDEFEPGLTAEPDIALLSTDELDRVLPVVPFSQQAAYFSGSATDGLQRWGASLAMTVVLSKVAVLATTSLTWPLWWPWALAAKKNLAVRRQYKYGGLWRTRVLGVTFTGRPKPFSSIDGGGLLGSSTVRLARVLVGDPGGAQTELMLPYDARYERIQPGEPAELVVLSPDTSFQQFKAVKDVYLPNSGLWVSEYPHADRTQFLEVSLQVEREAQEAADAEQWQQQQQRQQGQYSSQPYGQQYDGGGAYGPASGSGSQADVYGSEQQQQPY